MTKERPNAIDVAVAVYKQPNQFVHPKAGQYPIHIIEVIKSAAGDDATIQSISESHDISSDQVVQACKFYLQKLLAAAGSDPLRMLALDQGASEADIRDHKRWLLKWLHPDRNPSKWENALFLSISKAAKQLEFGNVVQSLASTSNSQRASKRSSRQPSWKFAKARRRQFSLSQVARPFILALSFAIVLSAVFAAAISNWTFIKSSIWG